MSQEKRPLTPEVLTPYTGGHTAILDGYIYELCPHHPSASKWGFVAQHRLVVERNQGWFLPSYLDVHHIDEIKTNNSLENLHVCTRSEHRKLHLQTGPHHSQKHLTEDGVREALQKFGSVKPAAAFLGVDHQTLRNRFPELLAPYLRRSPTHIDNPEAIELVRMYGPDKRYGYKEIAEMTGMSAQTVDRICRKHKIPWNKKAMRKEKDIPRTFHRKGKAGFHTQEVVDELRKLTQEKSCSLRSLANQLQMSSSTVMRICQRHGIEWDHKHVARRPRAKYQGMTPTQRHKGQSASETGSVVLLQPQIHREQRRGRIPLASAHQQTELF